MTHKGRTLIHVVDIREDGQSKSETSYESCMMCGNEKIRYVHILKHEEVEQKIRVGCICAEKMTSDYENPKRLERDLKNKANRRNTWLKKEWKVNKNGNRYLKHKGRYLLIYKDKKIEKYKVKIGDVFGRKFFNTLQEAKNAVFDGIKYLEDNDQW